MISEPLGEGLDQVRLADTWLPRDYNGVAALQGCRRPQLEQTRHLRVPSDEFGLMPTTRGEPTRCFGLTQDSPHRFGLGKPLQLVRSEILKFKRRAEEVPCRT